MMKIPLFRTLAFVMFCIATSVVSARAEEPSRIGSEACAGCHEDLAKAFRSTVHAKADPAGACETCHGPGGQHADEGNVALIRRFGPTVSAAERTAACLSCHGREPRGRTWASSEHASTSLACDDCHDPHASGQRTSLLRKPKSELCVGCHAEVRAQFLLTEKHPVARGAMECTDCHDPHAPSDRRLLGGFKQNACLRCHTEFRGPWVFEHEPVAAEGCIACHTPHGSVNRHLLTYQRVGDLCLQCHPEQPFFHGLEDADKRRTTGINDCTRCHTEIHGSNNDALFLN
jgi:DmsE family decaheme c-type cytochrome